MLSTPLSIRIGSIAASPGSWHRSKCNGACASCRSSLAASGALADTAHHSSTASVGIRNGGHGAMPWAIHAGCITAHLQTLRSSLCSLRRRLPVCTQVTMHRRQGVPGFRGPTRCGMLGASTAYATRKVARAGSGANDSIGYALLLTSGHCLGCHSRQRRGRCLFRGGFCGHLNQQHRWTIKGTKEEGRPRIVQTKHGLPSQLRLLPGRKERLDWRHRRAETMTSPRH